MKAYDAGDRVEAVRIAVVLRTLCHDTGSSDSLFNQMASHGPKLCSTAADVAAIDLTNFHHATLLAGIVSGNNIEYSAVVEAKKYLSYRDWWVEPVFSKDGYTYTRKDIVQVAANKDGGAHVDDGDAKLLRLKTGFWHKTTARPDGTQVTGTEDNEHFAILRRLAEEILFSPELGILIQ